MNRFTFWLPWILLVIVVTGFLSLEKKQNTTTSPPVIASDGVKLPEEQLQPLVERNREGVVISYHDAVKKATPAVVSIFTTSKVDNTLNPLMSDPIFREFLGEGMKNIPKNESNLGSGVIVREDGYILTNHHVIKGAEKIIVALHDGRRVEAKVIGTDVDTDLAVIKIDMTGLSVLPFKLSGNQVGDVVLAIGNPFGVGQTVTQGIISATERTDLGINTYENFVQTDAAINPGNSGGALIDIAGNLIGVNTAIFSRTGGSLGIGFAIPASTSKQVLDSILKHGRVVRGWLGISLARGNPQQNDLLHQHESAIIADILEDGPAAKSGLQKGDEIIQVNDEKISTATQLVHYIASLQPDTTVQISIKRNGEILNLSVVVGERKQQPLQRNPQYVPLPLGPHE